MTAARLAVALCLAFLIATPAAAVDLDAAKADGARLKAALAKVEGRDWSGAEAAVKSDPLLADLVLMKKIVAGRGSVAEYRGLVARRAAWPKRAMEKKLFGRVQSTGRSWGSLSGEALENRTRFRREMRRKDYDDAEAILAGVTNSRAALGVPEVWARDRRRLVRRALREGRVARAYTLASKHFLTSSAGYSYADLEWLSGWISLRFRHEPAEALRHFKKFEAAVDTPISNARAGYWLGRAHEAVGDTDAAMGAYARAARHQTAFYGQVAAARIGAAGDPRLVSNDLPSWAGEPAIQSELTRAALILHYSGSETQAFAALIAKAKALGGAGELGALASLALKLERPHYAIRIAKTAARKGVVLHPAYYPVTPLSGYASEIEPALALAIARQETEFNARAISRAGARGLMQLMPGTAKLVAKWRGETYEPQRLLSDWRYNARLGQHYLARQIRRYGGSYMLAAAAYNAGPGNANKWIEQIGDPRIAGTDIIDWIELIPFDETRNYVHRVMEALYIYRARIGGETGSMTILADLARGVTVPLPTPAPNRTGRKPFPPVEQVLPRTVPPVPLQNRPNPNLPPIPLPRPAG